MIGNCLACGGILGGILFSLGKLPLVDSFCNAPDEASEIEQFPVELCQCHRCSTIQIASPPDTRKIYENYIYESSSSPDLAEHFQEYARYIVAITGDVNTRVLEIGANDGLLLQKLVDFGFRRLVGVDPSPQTANINIEGVEIINDFFCKESVMKLEKRKFGLIVANNCFSHIPKLSEVLGLCSNLIEQTGTILVEVQSTLGLIEGVVFDYIYHEHYFYHTAQSFEKLAGLSGLELYHIEYVKTKGGSYRFLLGHKGAHAITSSVDYWKFREELAGIHERKSWQLMASYLSGIKSRLNDYIESSQRSIIAYGASATGTVFLKYMGVEEKIYSIVDDNPKRQGLYAPGSAIPVKSPSSIKSTDVCLVLAWRHSTCIVPKLKSQGIPFIIPLPEFKLDE